MKSRVTRGIRTRAVKIVPSAQTFARDLVLGFVSSNLLLSSLRPAALRMLGASIGRATLSSGGFYGGTNFAIGDGAFVNYGAFFDCSARITLGRNVYVAPRVSFLTSSHRLGEPDRRAGSSTAGAIRVEEGTWIGAGAMILPGVTIGAGCVIAAGAVVTKDCTAGGMYGGVPAKLLRNL